MHRLCAPVTILAATGGIRHLLRLSVHALPESSPDAFERPDLSMSPNATPTMVYDLIEACAQPGCPLCRVSDRWAERFISAILYEEVTDRYTRGRLSESFGFCHVHAWRAAEVSGSRLGLAIIYRSLLRQMSTALGQVESQGDRGRWWDVRNRRGQNSSTLQRLQSETECPACIHLRTMEAAALVALVDAVPENDRLRTALQSSSTGLCLPHLRGALDAAQAAPMAFAFLQEITQTKLAELQAEMDEFIRKYDHRFSREAFGVERDSWQRAVAWMVGGKVE